MSHSREELSLGSRTRHLFVLGLRQFQALYNTYLRIIMEPDCSSEDSETAYDTYHCRVAEAMKLITHLFDGKKRRLREFIENVDVAFQLMHPNKQDILLKFEKTKLTGDARSKLIVRDLTHTWALVKGILEENYSVRRTLDFYACRMFSARQEKVESVASLGRSIDEMQTELRKAARRICKPEEILGAVRAYLSSGKSLLRSRTKQ